LRLVGLIGLGLFACCVLLRVGLVSRHGLWADELFSLAMATGHSLEHPANRANPHFGDFVEDRQAVPPAAYSRYLEHDRPPSSPERVVRAVFRSDTSPPLYYLLLYGWTRMLGTGDVALRCFSILWALACFPILWTTAKRLGGETGAIATCILFTVSPSCVFYSTECRMYSLLLFCSVCTIWLTLSLWSEGPSAAKFALWVAVGIAGILTHYFFVFVWGAAVLWLQIEPGRYPRWLSAAGALLTAFLVLPWYMHLPEIMSEWRVTSSWLFDRPDGYHPILAAVSLLWSFFSIHGDWGRSPAFWGWLNLGFFLALGVAALRKLSLSLFRSERSLLWLSALGACLGLMTFDLLRGTYVTAVHRYALAGMPAAFLLAGVALSCLGQRFRNVCLISIALCSLVGVSQLYRADSRSNQNYPLVAKLLAADVGESDLIIVHSIPSGVAGIARYLKQDLTPDTHVGFASWVGQLRERRVPEDLQTLAAGRRKIVLVRTHDVGEPAPELSWLDENAKLIETKRIYGTTLSYFIPRDSLAFFPHLPTDAGRRIEAPAHHTGKRTSARGALYERRTGRAGGRMKAKLDCSNTSAVETVQRS